MTMNIRFTLVGLAAVAALVAPATTAVAQERAYAPVNRPGPALSESPDDLAASVRCTADTATAEHAPVLLTAGTTVTSRENFGWNWIPALQDAGFPVCTVDPVVAPQNMGDHQIRAEYVVHAIRHAYETSGRRPISILGHSQGGQIMRWPLRFWPDTRPMVDNVISMAPTHHGSVAVRTLCVPNCAPAMWQQVDDSAYTRALNSHQETFAGISYTNVYTKADEFVQPNLDDSGTSSLHTGDGRITNVALQDLCPASASEHIAVGTYDPIAYASLGMDALTHDGPADPSRIDRAVCTQSFMPGGTCGPPSASSACIRSSSPSVWRPRPPAGGTTPSTPPAAPTSSSTSAACTPTSRWPRCT